MAESGSSNLRFAVLVDGDNVQPTQLSGLLDEVRSHGEPLIRRVYGDWTMDNMSPWKEHLHKLAFQPMQQFRYVKQGNATDCALIIDAMDILYQFQMDGFCIVSSDSDFTRLATRLKESGKFVLGVGARKTPEPLVQACTRFRFLEDLAETKAAIAPKKASGAAIAVTTRGIRPPGEALPLLLRAWEASARENGWADFAAFAQKLYQFQPSFTSKDYGKRQLMDLVESFDAFEFEPPTRGPGQTFVRKRQAVSA